MRTVITRFPFNGLPKGKVFSYDPETDTHIVNLIAGGYLSDITVDEPDAVTRVIEMPSIESNEEFGVIGGEGQDQPSDSGGSGPSAVHAAGQEDVQGDEGTGPKVAKGRKSRTDVSADG